MTIEARESPFADGLSEDRERAQMVAARRRQRRQFVEIAIRIGSLAVVLSIWRSSAPGSIPCCSRRRARSQSQPWA